MDIKTENMIREDLIAEILEGLSKSKKELPSKLFYDERGSWLFEEITHLEEYYLTRTEIEIMKENLAEITQTLKDAMVLIELGSGSSLKTRMLLCNATGLRTYIPVDISANTLIESSAWIKKEFPHIEVIPVAADYTKNFELPDYYSRKVIYYPGSTIGNFHPVEAKKFLERISHLCGTHGSVIIGADLIKNRGILERAYNDKKRITAAFNLNILNHVNNITGSDFSLDKFRHFAYFNQLLSRIEMHLVSKENQQVHFGDKVFTFRKYETIHTENSYKYSVESFTRLVSDHFNVQKVWTDNKHYFGIFYLQVK